MSVDIHESLDHGDDRRRGQQRRDALEHQRVRTGPHDQRGPAEQDDPLRPLGDADLTLDAQTFRPRPGIGDQERSKDGHHAGDHRRNPIRHVRRGQEESADPDERGAVPDPIECRVVEGAELRDHGAAPRDLPVERVEDAAQEQQQSAQPNPA